MLDFDTLLTELRATGLGDGAEILISTAKRACATSRHGDLGRWQAAVDALPTITPVISRLNQNCVTIETSAPLAKQTHEQLLLALRQLQPWRKGPYSVCRIPIDTEWRSDWKWQRVSAHLTPLTGRRVLDVGCGSGYHVWRIVGAGAKVVIGIDPSVLFNMQFKALQHYINCPYAAVLPLKLEQLPQLQCFDTVFSMGVLYHRRDPAAHLAELNAAMAPAAELVLETLVLPAGPVSVLQPEERYARMRNVWQIPTSETLSNWLKFAGFSKIKLVSEAYTSTTEQRSTDWMQFESLSHSLDPQNHQLTIEGYPAPRRAVFIAEK